jgi:outer membrane protein assembly factor BamE (lipoprotein component of BamABCDE complex)
VTVRWRRRAILAAAVIATTPGCAMALHPHTTLAGQRFDSERASEVHEGQGPDQIAAILGEPLEDRLGESGVRLWRYFEKFQPRGCTPVLFGLSLGGRPTLTREVLVSFRDGRAETVRVRVDEPPLLRE